MYRKEQETSYFLGHVYNWNKSHKRKQKNMSAKKSHIAPDLIMEEGRKENRMLILKIKAVDNVGFICVYYNPQIRDRIYYWGDITNFRDVADLTSLRYETTLEEFFLTAPSDEGREALEQIMTDFYVLATRIFDGKPFSIISYQGIKAIWDKIPNMKDEMRTTFKSNMEFVIDDHINTYFFIKNTGNTSLIRTSTRELTDYHIGLFLFGRIGST